MTLDAGAERMIFICHTAQRFFTKKSLNGIFANVNLWKREKRPKIFDPISELFEGKNGLKSL